MTISDFSVHNVLRTYIKQYRIGKLVSAGKKSTGSTGEVDAVEISYDSKKLAFINNISNELFTRLEGKASKEDIAKRVTSELGPVIDDLAEEFSPDDKDIISIITDKLTELF